MAARVPDIFAIYAATRVYVTSLPFEEQLTRALLPPRPASARLARAGGRRDRGDHVTVCLAPTVPLRSTKHLGNISLLFAVVVPGYPYGYLSLLRGMRTCCAIHRLTL